MAFSDYIQWVVDWVACRQMSRAQIAEYLGGVGFADLYRRLKPLPEADRKNKLPPKEERLRVPGAVMDDDLAEDLGTDKRLIMLSGYTLRKQKGSHADVTAKDYLMAQRIVDGVLIWPERGKRKTHRMGFAQDYAGQWWRASWKKTKGKGKTKGEVLFNNLHKISERKIKRVLKKYGPPIKRREGETLVGPPPPSG